MLTGYTVTDKVNASKCFPLTFAGIGETVALIEIRAGDKLCKHLNALGLTVGMSVRVVQGGNCGPIILAVKNDTRLAIGQGMAHKIMVTRTEGNQ